VSATASQRLQRLLSLIPWVAEHDGPTVEEVCRRFGMTERELLADVDLVSMVGVPPYSPGDLFDVSVLDGRVFVHLSPSFDRAMRLTPEQALALVAAGASLLAVPGADPDGPLGRGLAKLAKALGLEAGEVVDVDLGRAPAGVLRALEQAVAELRPVELDYYTYGRDERAVRRVDPYKVWADRGSWYVWGHDHRRDERRLFRLDRVLDVVVLDGHFEAPAAGDVEPPELFRPGASSSRVTLDLEPAAAWVAGNYPNEAVEDLGGGRSRVTLAVAAVPWLERLLLVLGRDAEVARASPPELAEVGRAAAARILERYRASEGGTR
jgi:proteasome accessory factor C